MNIMLSTGLALIVGLASLAGSVADNAGTTSVVFKNPPVLQSSGKARAPVALTHRLTATPVAGVPVVLELSFRAPDDKAVRVDVAPDTALGARTAAFRIVKDKIVRVDLLPAAEGRYYVTVLAAIEGARGPNVRAFTVPVQVGKGGPVRAGKAATETPQGELLVRMRSR